MVWMQGYNDGVLILLIVYGEGCYQCSDDMFKQFQDDDVIVLSYGNNFNGLLFNIVGIINVSGSVLGLMFYFEWVCDLVMGGIDGCCMLEVLLG